MPSPADEEQRLEAADAVPEASVLRNSSWMLVAQVLGVAISGGVTILAVRVLSVTAWGDYTTALALVAIATVFASSGIATLALRKMSDDIEQQGSILGTSVVAIGGVAVLMAAAIFPVALGIGYGQDVIVLATLAMPLIFLQPILALLQVAFNARHALYLAARFLILQNAVYGVGAGVVLLLGLGAAGLVVATVLAAVVGAAAAFSLLRRRFRVSPQVGVPRREVPTYLRAALPLAGIGFVSIVYERLDILMLSALSGAGDVARYSVAYNFMRLTAIVPSVVAAAFFPVLNRALQQGSMEEAKEKFFFVVRLFILFSLPLALVLGVGAPVLVPFVFGSRYANSAHMLEILAVTPVVAFQIYAFWYVILAVRRERRVLAVWIAGLLANVLLNAALIPRYGPAGAAWSWVSAETLVATLQVYLVHRYAFRVPFRALLTRPAIAALVIAPAAIAVGLRAPVVGAALGGTACVAALLVSGYIRGEELKPIARALRSGVWLLQRRGT